MRLLDSRPVWALVGIGGYVLLQMVVAWNTQRGDRLAAKPACDVSIRQHKPSEKPGAYQCAKWRVK